MGKSLYQKWIDKYGVEVADEKMRDYREKMSERTSGENNHFFGKTHTQESIDKISEASTGRIAWNKGKKNPNMVGNKNPARRSDVRDKISLAVKKSYTEELRKERSEHFKRVRRLNKDKHRLMMESRGVWRRLDEISEFERYRINVRNLSQKSYSKYFYLIDPNRLRGRNHHLDHIYSIADGFDNNVDPKIISHPCNLRIVHHSLNESKGKSSEITLEELKVKIYEFSRSKNTQSKGW